MALPISLYDPMVLIEAAATILTGCYIVKLALLERAELLSAQTTTRSSGRTVQRVVRNEIPSSRIIAPLAAPQSSLPVLSPLPMNSAAKKVIRPVAFGTVRTAIAPERRNAEQKIVPINASKRGSKSVSARQLSTKLLQTDWLQRA